MGADKRKASGPTMHLIIACASLAFIQACAMPEREQMPEATYSCIANLEFLPPEAHWLDAIDRSLAWPVDCDDGALRMPTDYEQLAQWMMRALPWRLLHSLRGGIFDGEPYPEETNDLLVSFLAEKVGLTNQNLEWCNVGVNEVLDGRVIGSCAADAVSLVTEKLKGAYGTPENILKNDYAITRDLIIEREPPAGCEENRQNILRIYSDGRLRYVTALFGCGDRILYSDSEIEWSSRERLTDCAVEVYGDTLGYRESASVIEDLQGQCRLAHTNNFSLSIDHFFPEALGRKWPTFDDLRLIPRRIYSDVDDADEL